MQLYGEKVTLSLFCEDKPIIPGRAFPTDLMLYEIWSRLSHGYFAQHAKLLRYDIRWSVRAQKRTLATCHLRKSVVIVARELNYPEHHLWLEPLLYHEMCHAVIGIPKQEPNKRRSWHGKSFRELEHRHPHMRAFDRWVKSGGWEKAVRSDRARRAWGKRKAQTSL